TVRTNLPILHRQVGQIPKTMTWPTSRTNVANVVKYRGIAQMFVSKAYPMALSRSAALREHCLKALGFAPALIILLCASLVLALETPSKPFLDKNSFYLSSAGFRVQVADDPATK